MECGSFRNCSAPICPMVDNRAAWFPGDPVCVMQHPPEWVERHRRIARKVKPGSGIFTRRMLERDCRISKGMKGIDPERPLKEWPAMEEKWLEAHPEITPEEREEMRAVGVRLQALRHGKSC
ncbi:hypothetical protein FACS1894141_0550 [Spirochaetia bacterium]|nr:hypothetical protein FACS1894141_0550 [Spirochaetia bacterium]